MGRDARVYWIASFINLEPADYAKEEEREGMGEGEGVVRMRRRKKESEEEGEGKGRGIDNEVTGRWMIWIHRKISISGRSRGNGGGKNRGIAPLILVRPEQYNQRKWQRKNDLDLGINRVSRSPSFVYFNSIRTL